MAVLATLVLSACAGTDSKGIPKELPLSSAMGRVGMVRMALEVPDSAKTIVVIKDRHSTRPGNHRVRPQLRQVQKDNRRLVEYLVAGGYTLLGCEQAFGELEETAENTSQYSLLRKRVKWNYDLDDFATYQPILFKILWGEKLSVWGVEDPDLFEEDINDFKTFVKARQQARRNDLAEEDREAYLETLQLTRKKLARNIMERGKAAAENLLKLMDENTTTKAILMVGGAHVPAAIGVLKESGFNVYVFESSRYQTEASQSE